MTTRESDERPIATKALTGNIAIKDEEKGEVEAIVATLGVVDRDYEVITVDAVKDGAKVKMSGYGHDVMYGGTPVGRGALHIEDDKLVFRGKVFLSTDRGQETLSVLKEMGADQQWSFGFHIAGAEDPDETWTKKGARRILTKLEPFEVSPVVIGAGIGTRTVAAKEADEAAAREQAEADALAAAAATKATEEAAAAELKAAQETIEQKARAESALEEYHRVQRALQRMGFA